MSNMPRPVDRAKARMGFQTAMKRPACQNCAHAVEVSPTGATNDCWRFRCQFGGFGTTALAICTHHEPKDASREIKQPLVA